LACIFTKGWCKSAEPVFHAKKTLPEYQQAITLNDDPYHQLKQVSVLGYLVFKIYTLDTEEDHSRPFSGSYSLLDSDNLF